MHRRRLIGSGAAALAAMALPAAAQEDEPPATMPAGMVAGGGTVETALGPVDFGLAARANADGTVAGTLTLRDLTQPGNPVVMQATQLNRLEVHNDAVPTARQLIGWVSAAGQSALFLLQVDDAGGPGSGEDTFNLVVGGAAAPFLEGEEKAACDCATYSYSLKGALATGDIIVSDA